jgi:hypothetical protein
MPADLGHLARLSKPHQRECLFRLAAAAHTVRRPDIPNTTVAIATSAQAAT